MFIEIKDLEPEPLHVHRIFRMEEMDFSHEDAVLKQPVTADFTLEHKNSDLHINGTVQTVIHSRCSRCNKEFATDISVEYDLSYLPQPVWPDENVEVELKYEDMEISFYDGIVFDVNMMIREQIALAIPMKLICKEDCKGLCYQCGADLNDGICSCSKETGDPRLSVLLEFKKKSDQ